MSAERFSDDLDLVAPHGIPAIHFAGVLRTHLRILDAPPADAIDAIREWLAAHESSESLTRSLERSEWAAALTPG